LTHDWVGILGQGVVSALISGAVLAWVKARLEHQYSVKRDNDIKNDRLREGVIEEEKKLQRERMTDFQNQISGIGVRVGKVQENLTRVDTKVQIVVERQANQNDKIDDLKGMIKQNFGKVHLKP
jgi:peptidoglycan hydrolase CwlO-like protein